VSNRPRVGVLDYGSGNLHSVCRALQAAGAEVLLDRDPDVLLECAGVVLPGVGAFAACAAGLRAVGGDVTIRSALAAQRPVLGICVGHQVLFDAGVEHGERAEGLGLFRGVVQQLPAERLPHMGWNLVEPPADSALFAGVADERFYFVHSYGILAEEDAAPRNEGVTWARHQQARFVAAIESGLVSSTQFHPEKSGGAGARLLRNWIAQL